METVESARQALQRLKTSFSDLRARHRERHQSSGFGFVFADRIDYMDPVRWDAVTRGGSFFLRRDVLRVIEVNGPKNVEPRYAMVFRDDKVVAVIAVQIVTVTGEHLRRDEAIAKSAPSKNLLRRILAPAARSAGSKLRERMLVAGNLLSWGFHGIGFLAGEDSVVLWPAIAEALYRIRRAERLGGQTDFVMVKDVTAHQAGLEALRRYSYRALETEPNMVLALDPNWKSYDCYLAALDAKYRKKVKDQGKKLASAGCTVEALTDPRTHAARLHELYLAVQGNASVRLVTVRENYFSELARVAPDDFRCTVVKRGDHVIGFVTTVRDGETAIGYYIGFDRTAAAEGLPIYLRLLHATVSDAIAWRCTRLSLGRTALEPKAGLGARPEPMSVWVRHRIAPLNWILRGLLDAVPHAEAPERSPFKATPASDTTG
jgi:hypothetical protein